MVYVSSSIYNNLGSSYIADILRNNLHFAVSTEEDSASASTICSLKNTGYNAAKDVKILIWSLKPGFSRIEFEADTVKRVSEEYKSNFLHAVFKMENDLYPGETKTVRFIFKKGSEGKGSKNETGDSESLKVKVYSSNSPAIEVQTVTEKTTFSFGPYLFDLLWVIGWTYVDIGLFIVLPLALIIFGILAILNKLLKLGVGSP